MKLPSALISGWEELRLAAAAGEPLLPLTRVTAPEERLQRNTSSVVVMVPGRTVGSVCPGTRFFAWLVKTTHSPSALIRARPERPSAATLGAPAAWETSVVVPVIRSQRNTSFTVLVSVIPATRWVPGLL